MAQLMQHSSFFYPFLRLLAPSETNLFEICLFILGSVLMWFMIIDCLRGPTAALRAAVDNSKGSDFLLPDPSLFSILIQFVLQFYCCQTFGFLLNIFSGFITYSIWNYLGLPTWHNTGLVMGNKLSGIRLPIFDTPSDTRLGVLKLCTFVSAFIRFLQILYPFREEIKHNESFAFIVQLVTGGLLFVSIYDKISEKKLVLYLGIITMNLAPLIMFIVPSKNPITENTEELSNNIICTIKKQKSSHSFTAETSPKEPNLNKPSKKQKRNKRKSQMNCF